MTKAVAICGTKGSVAGSAGMDTVEVLQKVGQNTGNLVFQYAVFQEISAVRLVAGEDLDWDPQKVRESCSVIVVPAANFIRENFDFTGFVSFLEKCNLPMVVVGLGAQADNYKKTRFDFHPSVERFLSLIKERCLKIGVRGEYTAEVLSSQGIGNMEIIGCPSNFLNADDKLHLKLDEKWRRRSTSLAVNGDTPWPKTSEKRSMERRLYEIARDNRGVYVQQSVEPLIRLVRAANPYQSPAEAHVMGSIRKALAPKESDLEFQDFLRTQVRVYFNVDQWLEDMSKLDLSLGPRLHGNMVAMQSGTPSIWIYHDARTQELAETMQLPRISVEGFLAATSIEAVKSEVEGSWSEYGARRMELYARYRNILIDSGISVRNGLSR